MTKKQVPKSGFRSRQPVNVGRLEQSLKKEWRTSTIAAGQVEEPTLLGWSPLDVTVEDPVHMARARDFDLPADFTDGSLVTRTFFRYLDVRSSMTQGELEAARKTFIKVVDQLVFTEFIPDQALAEHQELLDVARGIAVAKVAISQTADAPN